MTAVAERLLPSVASLRVVRRVPGGRVPAGSCSAVVVTPDGFLLTSAHVVEGAAGGTASFADGAEHEFAVVGADPLSDLALVRARPAGWRPPPWAAPTGCGWASWSWPSATPWATPGR